VKIASLIAAKREVLRMVDEYSSPPDREMLLDGMLYSYLAGCFGYCARRNAKRLALELGFHYARFVGRTRLLMIASATIACAKARPGAGSTRARVDRPTSLRSFQRLRRSV
jgi:hypothetical protein